MSLPHRLPPLALLCLPQPGRAPAQPTLRHPRPQCRPCRGRLSAPSREGGAGHAGTCCPPCGGASRSCRRGLRRRTTVPSIHRALRHHDALGGPPRLSTAALRAGLLSGGRRQRRCCRRLSPRLLGSPRPPGWAAGLPPPFPGVAGSDARRGLLLHVAAGGRLPSPQPRGGPLRVTRRGAGWAPTAPAVSPAGAAVGGARPSPAERLPRRGGVVEEGAPAAGEGEAAGAMWQSIGLTLLVIVATLACVLLFMLCGESRPPRSVRGEKLPEGWPAWAGSAPVPHSHPASSPSPAFSISGGSFSLRLTEGNERAPCPGLWGSVCGSQRPLLFVS